MTLVLSDLLEGERSSGELKEVERVHDSIVPPPGATRIAYKARRDPMRRAFVTVRYRIDREPEFVMRHYCERLEADGWRAKQAGKPCGEWTSGGRVGMRLCKEGMAAEISYADAANPGAFVYAFVIVLNSRDCR